jgi:hypothetical protein
MVTSTRSARRPSPTSSGTTSEPGQSLQRGGASSDRPRYAGPSSGPTRADGGPIPPARRAVAAVRVARAGDGLGGMAGRNARRDRPWRRAPAAVADRGGSARGGRPAATGPGRGAGRQPASADRAEVAGTRPGGSGARARCGWPDRAVRRTARRVEPRRLPVRVRSRTGRRIASDAPAPTGLSGTRERGGGASRRDSRRRSGR